MNCQELRFRGIKLNELEELQNYLMKPAKKNPDVDLSLSYMNHGGIGKSSCGQNRAT